MSFHHRPPRRRDAPGTPICSLAAIPEGQGRGFELVDAAGNLRAVFVVRRGRRACAYLNVCPHAGTSLDFNPDTFIAPDGGAIQCATHGARFRIDDGACLSGPCRGRGLTPVTVRVTGETIRLADNVNRD